MPATASASDSVKDSTVFWFVKLEAAVERGDLADAHRAQQQLKRLGVKVEYAGLRRSEVANAAR